MSIYRFVFILITEIVRIIITRRFVFSFLRLDEYQVRRVCAYLFSIVITTLAYSFINLSWVNLLSTFLGLMAISLSYSGSIKKKVLFVFYILAVSCIIDLMVYAFLSKTFDYENYSEFASILSLLLLLLLTQLFTRRILEKNKNMEYDNKYWWKYILSLMVCIATSLVVIMDKTISPLSLSIVSGSFLVVNLIIVYLIDDLIDTSQNAIDNFILREQMKAYEREISLQNENLELIIAFRHDMKRHLAEIAELARKKEEKFLLEYINDLGEELKETSPISGSGNPGLDTVLNYMLQRAVDRNILVSSRIAVPKDIELSIFDMNIILGNLIENAIEANENIETPQIDLIISYVKDSLIIELSNTYSNKIILKDKYPVSTKQPSKEHGYGIKNIRRVLDKYAHTFDIDWTLDRFTIKILMKVS